MEFTEQLKESCHPQKDGRRIEIALSSVVSAVERGRPHLRTSERMQASGGPMGGPAQDPPRTGLEHKRKQESDGAVQEGGGNALRHFKRSCWAECEKYGIGNTLKSWTEGEWIRATLQVRDTNEAFLVTICKKFITYTSKAGSSRGGAGEGSTDPLKRSRRQRHALERVWEVGPGFLLQKSPALQRRAWIWIHAPVVVRELAVVTGWEDNGSEDD